MIPEDVMRHLGSITTLWSMVLQARGGQEEAETQAQQQLLARYGPAIQRYLLGALHDADVAADVYQEFALRLLRGDYHNVQPGRGRFRDYVKTVLRRLIADHFKGANRRGPSLEVAALEPAVEESLDLDAAFLADWREQLLNRCWAILDQSEAAGGPPFAAVLRLRAEQPTLRSPELAEALAARLKKPTTAAALRQLLHRARERFAMLLIEEVAQSLRDPGDGNLEQELIDLGLWPYCQEAFQRWAAG